MQDEPGASTPVCWEKKSRAKIAASQADRELSQVVIIIVRKMMITLFLLLQYQITVHLFEVLTDERKDHFYFLIRANHFHLVVGGWESTFTFFIFIFLPRSWGMTLRFSQRRRRRKSGHIGTWQTGHMSPQDHHHTQIKMFRDLKERISETAEMQKKLEKQLPHLDKVKLSAAEIFYVN